MNKYEINLQTLAIIPMGENKCKVIEENREMIINSPVIKIIDDSCKFFGSSYKGRFEGTKNLIKISHKAPIIIEEYRKIIFFPTTSPRLEECAWISLNNIDNYFKVSNGTIIKFTCGKNIQFNLSYGIIDNQVLRATRLEVLFEKRIKNLL